MAFNFRDLKRKKKLDDDKPGREKYRGKSEEDDSFLNPYAAAKKEAFDEETETVPVDDEEDEIEEMAEGEAGHTAEKKLDGGDHEDETDLYSEEEEEDEEHPDPGKKKARGKPKPFAGAKGKGKDEPSFTFRRFL
jgi:hypothetical protein